MEWILRNWILLFAWCNEVVKWKRESGKIHWMITFILRNIVCHLYIYLCSHVLFLCYWRRKSISLEAPWMIFEEPSFALCFPLSWKKGCEILIISLLLQKHCSFYENSGMMVGMSLCYKHSSIPFLLSSLRLLSKTLIAIFDFCWALQTDI